MQKLLKITERLRALDGDIFVLRLGLGLTFLYAAFDMLRAPENWIGFIPEWVEILVSRGQFLYVHTFFELALGIALIAGVRLWIVAAISFLDLFSILAFYGIDAITFRDFGLAMAALALCLRTLPERTFVARTE